MKAVRVIRTNYSLLWQHLDASKVLPKLVDESVISEAKKKWNHINRVVVRMLSSSMHSSLLNAHQRGY